MSPGLRGGLCDKRWLRVANNSFISTHWHEDQGTSIPHMDLSRRSPCSA